MANIRFRLAKPSDAKQIAYVHLHIRDKYDQGFFAQVNYSFLKQYYKVMLNDPNEVIVCAEDENGLIVGFSSGSLDASKQMKSMRDNKFSFLWPLFTSAISNPTLIIIMSLLKVPEVNIGDGCQIEKILKSQFL